jgi:pyruvate/oxaloacetate carboxyltransferase
VLLGERYKIIPEEIKNYVRGYYGRPPAPIDPTVQKLVIGDEEPIDCRPADLIPPGMEKAKEEIGDLARSEEDVISYALFPQTARPFLERRARSATGGSQEAIVAAIAALLVEQQVCQVQPVGADVHPTAALSPWKMSYRPQAARWTGLIDGAGGSR